MKAITYYLFLMIFFYGLAACGGSSDPAGSEQSAVEEFIDSHLCEGEAVLSGVDKYDQKPDKFIFKAKSRLMKSGSGRTRIDYSVTLYVKPGRTGLYNGSTYLVEWKTIESEDVKDSGRLIPSPLMPAFLAMPNPTQQEFDRMNANRLAAESRFMRFEFQNSFFARIFPQKKAVFKKDKQAELVVYNTDLKVEARFHCPAYIEGK